jgi:hypothetical protein
MATGTTTADFTRARCLAIFIPLGCGARGSSVVCDTTLPRECPGKVHAGVIVHPHCIAPDRPGHHTHQTSIVPRTGFIGSAALGAGVSEHVPATVDGLFDPRLRRSRLKCETCPKPEASCRGMRSPLGDSDSDVDARWRVETGRVEFGRQALISLRRCSQKCPRMRTTDDVRSFASKHIPMGMGVATSESRVCHKLAPKLASLPGAITIEARRRSALREQTGSGINGEPRE